MAFYRCRNDLYGYCLQSNEELSKIEAEIFAKSNSRPYPAEEVEKLQVQREKLMKCRSEPSTCNYHQTSTQYFDSMCKQLHKPDVKAIRHKIIVEPGGQGKSETRKALRRISRC